MPDDRPALIACRKRRRNRRTGGIVRLLDATSPPAEGRWVTYCDLHDVSCPHQNYQIALMFLGSPWEWSAGCRILVPAEAEFAECSEKDHGRTCRGLFFLPSALEKEEESHGP